MLTISKININRHGAWHLARSTGIQTSEDIGYIVKSAFRESWGQNPVRPYRIENNAKTIDVLGYSDGPVEKPTDGAGEYLITNAASVTWQPKTGDTYLCDVIACPMESMRLTESGSRTRDIKCRHGYSSASAAYADWLDDKLNDVNSGCVVSSQIEFTEMTKFIGLRNQGPDKPAYKFSMPRIRVSVYLTVTEVTSFEKFLNTGIGRERAFGFGSIVPFEVLKSLEF